MSIALSRWLVVGGAALILAGAGPGPLAPSAPGTPPRALTGDGVGVADCCWMADAEGQGGGAPASDPAAPAPPAHVDRPAGQPIRGEVAISGSWSLQKPDLTRVVVYLASAPALDDAPRQRDHETVAQKNKKFVPNFVVVSRGTVIEFPNWDDFDHNVFSRSKAAPAFDLDRYPRGQSKTRTFEKTGVVQIFCNIHPKMRAIVFVTPNPFFTRADEQGRFELIGAPPGSYEIVAWHERCKEQRQPIEIAADAAASTVRFTLEEDRAAILENDPPRDEDYGPERGLGVKRERLNLPVVGPSHPARDEEPK